MALKRLCFQRYGIAVLIRLENVSSLPRQHLGTCPVYLQPFRPLMVHQGRRPISRICPLEVMSETGCGSSGRVMKFLDGRGAHRFCVFLLIMCLHVTTPPPPRDVSIYCDISDDQINNITFTVISATETC